jgi:hypothetical protein
MSINLNLLEPFIDTSAAIVGVVIFRAACAGQHLQRCASSYCNAALQTSHKAVKQEKYRHILYKRRL